LINPTGDAGRIIFDYRDRYLLTISAPIVEEIRDVLGRSRLQVKYPQIQGVNLALLLDILAEARIVKPTTRVTICRDPSDDKFFECAVGAGARYIVSEDRDILDVGEYEGIRTVTAAEFIAALDQS